MATQACGKHITIAKNTRHVSPEVSERIEAAMREINDHGNAHARRLARGASDFTGLTISDIESPFSPASAKRSNLTVAFRFNYDLMPSID